MVSTHIPFWAWFLPAVLTSPWLVGSIVLWRIRPRDGALPASFAELSLRR